jgi:hypothetical protein
MENKRLIIGAIGPTNIQRFSKLTGKTQDFLLGKAQAIGEILAKKNCELWVNSDKGMLVAVARVYKSSGGKRCVVLYPDKGEPWPKKHATPYIRYADELRKEPNWFWSNYNVVTLPDICICVGLSAGTLSELAYIKWNYQLKCGNLKKLVAIKELLRDQTIPPEIEEDAKEIIHYLEKTEDLDNFWENFQKELATPPSHEDS